MFGDSFLPVRSTLRTILVCSLLVFAHVLLVILAVARKSGRFIRADNLARELLAEFPEISRAAKTCSALAFLTLLWKIFLLLELADLASPTRRASLADTGSDEISKSMVDGEVGVAGRKDVTEFVHPFTVTMSEVIVGNLAIVGWICEYFSISTLTKADKIVCLPSAMTIFRVFGATEVTELSKFVMSCLGFSGADRSVLLPLSFTIAFFALIASQLHLLIQIYLLRNTRAKGSGLWTVRTGHWDTRVKLSEKSGEKV